MEKYVTLLIPNIIMSIMGNICPMKKNRIKLIQQPPSYIFGIVWPILNLFTGYCLKISLEQNDKILLYLIISQIIITSLWLYFTNCKNDKKSGLYLIALLFMVTFMIKENSNNIYIKNMMIIYLSWTLYAFILNFKLLDY